MRKFLKWICFFTLLATFLGPLTIASGARVNNPFVMKKIVQGAPIHGANGIFFDAQDRLYIASAFGNEIVVMDPQTGVILNRLSRADGVVGPDDLTFGPDGSLYWTSILTGRVGRRTPDGVTTIQPVSPGTNPITFSNDGRLFVALDFFGDGLYELDPELVNPPHPIIVASGGSPMPLGFLNGMDFGPDGRLYGPIYTQGRIISLDVDSCSPSPTSDPWNDCDITTVASGFGVPAAVKFDSHGNLFTVDQVGLLYRVDVTNGEKSVVAELSPLLDNLTFDSRGRLFISSAGDGFIQEILPGGQPRMVSRGGMIAPGGVAVLPRPRGGDALFIADLWSLRQYNGLKGRLEHTEYNVAGLSQITSPFSVSADGQNLVLSSWIGGMVQVWDPVNNLEVESYSFPAPLNAIRFQDDLVVADLGMGGVFWASSHAPLIQSPHVIIPSGLAATQDDLYLSDWITGILWQLYDDGMQVTPPRLVTDGLSFPEGMTVYTDGSLLVVETGIDQVTHVDPATGEKTPWFVGLNAGMVSEAVPPTFLFNGIAVGSRGEVYVSSDIDNAIYRFWPLPK